MVLDILYGTGQIGATYSCGSESLKHQPSTSTNNPEDMNLIKKQLSQSLETNDKLSIKIKALETIVKRFLPPEAHALIVVDQEHPPSPPQNEHPEENDKQQNLDHEQNPDQDHSSNYG